MFLIAYFITHFSPNSAQVTWPPVAVPTACPKIHIRKSALKVKIPLWPIDWINEVVFGGKKQIFTFLSPQEKPSDRGSAIKLNYFAYFVSSLLGSQPVTQPILCFLPVKWVTGVQWLTNHWQPLKKEMWRSLMMFGICFLQSDLWTDKLAAKYLY